MSDNDDRQIGYLLSRREVIAMLGATGATLAAGPAHAARPGIARGTTRLPSCVVRPTQTRGPYFVDERLVRTDIRSDPTDGSSKAGHRRRNARDGIYRNGGDRLMLDVTQGGPGWTSRFDIGMLAA